MSVSVPVGFKVDFSDVSCMNGVELFPVKELILLRLPEFEVFCVDTDSFSTGNNSSLHDCPYRLDFSMTDVSRVDSKHSCYFCFLDDGDVSKYENVSCTIVDITEEVKLSMMEDVSIILGSECFAINIDICRRSIDYSYGLYVSPNKRQNLLFSLIYWDITDLSALCDSIGNNSYKFENLDVVDGEYVKEHICSNDCKILVFNGVKVIDSLVLSDSLSDVFFYYEDDMEVHNLYLSKRMHIRVLIKVLHSILRFYIKKNTELLIDLDKLYRIYYREDYFGYWKFIHRKENIKFMDIALNNINVVVY